MSKRKSFVLYHDSLSIFDKIPDKTGMALFKAIRDYSINVINGDDEDIVIEDELVKFLFEQFKNQLKRDNDKYLEISKKRKKYASDGGKTTQERRRKKTSEPEPKDGDTKMEKGKRWWYIDGKWQEEVMV